MENFNKTQEYIINSNKKESKTLIKANLSPSISKLNSLNIKSFNRTYNHFRNRDFIISKNKSILYNLFNNNNNQFSLSSDTTPRKDLSSNFTSKLLNNEIIKILTKSFNNKNDNNNIKKEDIGTQCKNNEKVTKNKKFQFLKKLIENSNNNCMDEIDCILESPYRGVEKIGDSLSKTYSPENDKNLFRPIFINDNYKGYFCIKNFNKKNSRSLKTKDNIKKLNFDKYDELKKNKEIDNPLKRLSKLSGLSCSKLRKAIDYSLSHRINNFWKIIKKKYNVKINYNDNHKNLNVEKKPIFENKKIKKNKCIYSKIELKSKNINNPKLIKLNSINLENETLLDNVIGNNFFKDKKYKKNYYIKKKYQYFSPISLREKDMFKNLSIKDKI